MFSIGNHQNRCQKGSWLKWSTQVQKLTQATEVGHLREINQPPRAWLKLSKMAIGVDHFSQSIRTGHKQVVLTCGQMTPALHGCILHAVKPSQMPGNLPNGDFENRTSQIWFKQSLKYPWRRLFAAPPGRCRALGRGYSSNLV